MQFLPHPNAFEHMRRRNILGEAVCSDTMHLKFLEAQPQNLMGCLRRVAISPETTVQFISDVRKSQIRIGYAYASVADQQTIFLECDRKLEFAPWPFDLLVQEHLDEATDIEFRTRIP